MNERPGWLWCVQVRPLGDQSGVSDSTVMTPRKDHCRSRAKELGDMYEIVWQGWIKYPRTGLRRVLSRSNDKRDFRGV
jgi:hypothetical protein